MCFKRLILTGNIYLLLLIFFFQSGASCHDAVKVPFTLLPGTQNEGQFAFTVSSISMPQKLKGTLTYILKVNNGI